MSKTYSAKRVVSILCRKFGFSFISQRGSHIKLRKTFKDKIVTTIVPNHRELAQGTVKGILWLAEVDEKEFRKK